MPLRGQESQDGCTVPIPFLPEVIYKCNQCHLSPKPWSKRGLDNPPHPGLSEAAIQQLSQPSSLESDDWRLVKSCPDYLSWGRFFEDGADHYFLKSCWDHSLSQGGGELTTTQTHSTLISQEDLTYWGQHILHWHTFLPTEGLVDYLALKCPMYMHVHVTWNTGRGFWVQLAWDRNQLE